MSLARRARLLAITALASCSALVLAGAAATVQVSRTDAAVWS